jgi:hypothetical protein
VVEVAQEFLKAIYTEQEFFFLFLKWGESVMLFWNFISPCPFFSAVRFNWRTVSIERLIKKKVTHRWKKWSSLWWPITSKDFPLFLKHMLSISKQKILLFFLPNKITTDLRFSSTEYQRNIQLIKWMIGRFDREIHLRYVHGQHSLSFPHHLLSNTQITKQ